MKKLPLVLGLVATIPFVAVLISARHRTTSSSEQASAIEPDAAIVERTRKKFALLDNVYKQTIMLIADNCAHDEDDSTLCSTAALLFANTSKSGSHQVRLIDAAGQIYGLKNAAGDAFEREGIKHLQAGGETYEQVVQQDGQYQLRILTPVPVAMKKCVMRHEQSADAQASQFIGAISYTVPFE